MRPAEDPRVEQLDALRRRMRSTLADLLGYQHALRVILVFDVTTPPPIRAVAAEQVALGIEADSEPAEVDLVVLRAALSGMKRLLKKPDDDFVAGSGSLKLSYKTACEIAVLLRDEIERLEWDLAPPLTA